MSLDGAKFVCLDEKEVKETGEKNGTVIKAKGRKFTVGYYTNCDYILEDARAKGIHCEINCDAFGRVTINNMSEEHPIIVNDHITNVKRPLWNDSNITILDKKFLWKFPKSTSSEFEDLTVEQMSTPEKEAGILKVAPSSCPDFTLHRNFVKRFTVHNFAYCIQSEEQSTEKEEEAREIENENTSELETPTAEKSEMDACDLPKDTNRCVTPELRGNPNTELMETPKMNLINCTKNKENASTEKKKKLLSFCNQSDVVITSFSPRVTGVRIEKSFTAVVKPTTPKSVYSTPKSMLSEFNDDDSHNFIDFSTPATSKKTGVLRLAKNSSMHLIDLTITPTKFSNKNRPVSPYLKSALKSSIKKNLQTVETPSGSQKLTGITKLRSYEQVGVNNFPATPIATSNISQNTQTPSSVESVISVDSASDASSVIEVSTDAASPSPRIPSAVVAANTNTQASVKSQLKTPKKLTASPHRTPQSLMKRAILTSAKKHIQNTRTPGSRLVTGSSAAGLNFPKNSPVTPKTGTAASTSKEALLASRQSLMSPVRQSLSAATSSTGTKSSANLNQHSTIGRRKSMATSTPVSHISTSMQQSHTVASKASSSSLHKVRKSFGYISLNSHISKTRRSSIIPNRTSTTGLGAHLVAKARRSLACPTPSTSARARQQAIASTSFVKSLQSMCKTEQSESKPEIVICSDENPTYSALKKSRTFILDVEGESTKPEEFNKTISPVKNIDGVKRETELNKTFSPVKNIEDFKLGSNINKTFSPVKNVDDDGKQEDILNTTFSPVKDTKIKRDLNKTCSPEKQKEAEAEVAETIDVSAEVQPVAAQKDINDSNPSGQRAKDIENKQNFAKCSKNVSSISIAAEQLIEHVDSNTDIISESFAEVVENTTQATIADSSENQENKVIENQIDQSTTISKMFELMIPEMIEKANKIVAEPAERKDNSTVETVSVSESSEYVENLLQETEEGSESRTIPSDIAKENKEPALEKWTNEKEELLSDEKDESDVTLTASNVSVANEEQLHTDETTSNLDTVTLDANSEKNMEETVSESQETAELLEEIEYVLNKSDELEQKHIKKTQKIDENITETLGEDRENLKTKKYDATEAGEAEEKDEEKNLKSEENSKIEVEKVTIADSKSIEETEKEVETESDGKNAFDSETQDESDGKEKQTEKATLDEIFLNIKKTNAEPELMSSTSLVEDITMKHSARNEVLKSDDVENENQGDEDGNDATTTMKSSSKEATMDEILLNTIKTNAEPELMSSTSLVDGITEKHSARNEVLKSDDVENENQGDEDGNDATTAMESSSKEAILDEILLNTRKTKAKPELMSSTSLVDGITEKHSARNEVLKSDDVEKENQGDEDGNDATTAMESSSKEVFTPNLRGVREMLQTPKDAEAKTPRFVGMRNLLRTPKGNGDDEEAEELEGIKILLKTPLVDTMQEEEDEDEKRKIEETPQTSMKSTTKYNFPTQTTSTPVRRSSRRASISADEAISNLYTPKSVKARRLSSSNDAATPSAYTTTPKRITTRRMSTAENAKTPSTFAMTPKRITTRRASLSLEPEDISLKLTPSAAAKRVKRVTIFEENDEEMGAIIEEEKEEVETTADEIKLVVEEKVSRESQDTLHEPTIVDKSENALIEQEVQEPKTNNDESEIIEDSICEVISASKSEGRMESDSKDAPELKEAQLKSCVAEKEASIMEVEIHEIEDDSLCEIVEDNSGEKKLPTAIEEESEILDESDYEYGKEISKELNAGHKNEKFNIIAETEISIATTPKIKKSIKIDAPPTPKTPIMSGVRELLKTPKATNETPRLEGVCELLRTPKQSATHANDSNLEGLTDLVKTPKTEVKYKKEITFKEEEEDLPSTSADAAARSAEFLGTRQMLRAPKRCSTPRMNANGTVERGEDDEDLDKFFKTPRAKNVMIPGLPSSAVIEKRSKLFELLPTTEYDLNATNDEAQLEELFKTPVSIRFGERLGDESYDTEEKVEQVPESDAAHKDEQNLSAEEAFDKLTGQPSAIKTPARNVYTRKSHALSAIQKSPFSGSDVLSDLPKTDVQEWVDSLEDDENPLNSSQNEYTDQNIVEQEITINSMHEENKNESACDPLIQSAFKNISKISEIVPDSCVKVYILSDANTTTSSEKMVDVSAVSVSVTDPLVGGSAFKLFEQRAVEKSGPATERSTTPKESEMSGINLLDETNESIFSETLKISDSESENDTSVNVKVATNKAKETINIDSMDIEKMENIISDEVKGDKELGTVEEAFENEDIIQQLVVSDTESSDEYLEVKEEITTEHAIESEFENFKENAIVLEQRSRTPDIIKVRSKLSRKTLGAHEELQLTIDFNDEKYKISQAPESATKAENLHSIETIEEITIRDYDEGESNIEMIEGDQKEETVPNEEEAKPIDNESIEKSLRQETIEYDNDVALTEGKITNASGVEKVVDDNIAENTENIESEAAIETVEEKKFFESESIDEQSLADTSNIEQIVTVKEVTNSEVKVSEDNNEQSMKNIINDDEIISDEEVTSSEMKVSESNDEQKLDNSPKIETDKLSIAEEMVTETIDDHSTGNITAEEEKVTDAACCDGISENIASSEVSICYSNEMKLSESNEIQVTKNSSNETLSTVEVTSSEEKMSDSNDETIVTVIAVTSSEKKVFDSCNENMPQSEFTEEVESSNEEIAQAEITGSVESSKEVISYGEISETNTPRNKTTETSKEEQTLENVTNNEIMETVGQDTQIEEHLPETCGNTSTENNSSEKNETNTKEANLEKNVIESIDVESAENSTDSYPILEVPVNPDKESDGTVASTVTRTLIDTVDLDNDIAEVPNDIALETVEKDLKSDEISEDLEKIHENQISEITRVNTLTVTEANKYVENPKKTSTSPPASSAIIIEEDNVAESIEINEKQVKSDTSKSTEIVEDKVQKSIPKRIASQSSQCSSIDGAAEPPKREKTKAPIEEVLEETVQKPAEEEDKERITTIDFEIKKDMQASEKTEEGLKIVVKETLEVHNDVEVNVNAMSKRLARKASAKSAENTAEVKEDNVTNTHEILENINKTESEEIDMEKEPSSSNAENLKTIDEAEVPENHKITEENVAEVLKKITRKDSAQPNESTIEEKSKVESVENKNESESDESHKSNDPSSIIADLKTIDVKATLENKEISNNEKDDNAELPKKRTRKASVNPLKRAIEETTSVITVASAQQTETETIEAIAKNSEVHKNAEDNVEIPKKRTRKSSAKPNENIIDEPVEKKNESEDAESHKSNEQPSTNVESQQTMDSADDLENIEVSKISDANIPELPKKRTRKASAKPNERVIAETSNVDATVNTNQTKSLKIKGPHSSSNIEKLKDIDEAALEVSESHKNAEHNIVEIPKKITRKFSAKSNEKKIEEKCTKETVENVYESESHTSNAPSSSNVDSLKIIDKETALENTKEVLKNVEGNATYVPKSSEDLNDDNVDISKMDTVENKVGGDENVFSVASSSSSETVADNVEIAVEPESENIKLIAEDEAPKVDVNDLKDKSNIVVEHMETIEVSKTRKRTGKGSQSSQYSAKEDELPKRRIGRRKAETAGQHKDVIEHSELSGDAQAGHVAEEIAIQETTELDAVVADSIEKNVVDMKVKATRGKRERNGSQSSQYSTKEAVVPKRRGGRTKKLKTALDELKEDAKQTESSDIESVSDGKELFEETAYVNEGNAPVKDESALMEEVPASEGAIKHDEALIEKNNKGGVIAKVLEEQPKYEEDDTTKGDEAVITQSEITDSTPLRKGKATRAKKAPTRKAEKIDEVEHLATEQTIEYAEQIEGKQSKENAEIKPQDIVPKRRGGRKKLEQHVETIEDKPSNETAENMNAKESSPKDNSPQEIAQEIETKTTIKRRGKRKVAEAVVPAKRRATRKKHEEQHDYGNEDHAHRTADDEEQTHQIADDEEQTHKTADDEAQEHKTADYEKVAAKEEDKTTAGTTEIADDKVESKDESEDVKEEINMEHARNIDTKTEIDHDNKTKSINRRGRKRKESHADDEQHDDTQEPPKKRGGKKVIAPETTEITQPIATPVPIPRRTRKVFTLDVTTPSQTPTRSVPRRAATAHERNYDESSDTESSHHVTYKRRSGGESNTHKTNNAEKATTSRGRTRKPTAKVQQFLEEERAKSGTPKKRMLLAALVADATPMSATLTPTTRRGRKASTMETDHSAGISSTPLLLAAKKRGGRVPRTAQLQQSTDAEPHATELEETATTHSSCTEEKEEGEVTVVVAVPPAKGRGRGRKASVVDVDTDSDAIVPATPTPITNKRGRAARRLPSKTTERKDHSSELEEAAAKPKVAKRGGRGTAAQKKIETEDAAIATTNIEDMEDDEEENESLAHVAEKVAATKRTAAASTETATATKRGRGRKKVVADEEINEEATDSVVTARTSTRAHGGRSRKVVRFEPTNAAAITAPHIVATDDVAVTHGALLSPPDTLPSPPAKRATRARRK